MPALKEFANFIILNMANLAETYAQLLAESGDGYESFPADQRIASGRRLLRAVIEAYESETADPLCRLFDEYVVNEGPRRWAKDIAPPHPFIEVECLGQTLVPVVTNLEASKFLWQILSEVRAIVLQLMDKAPPISASTPTVPVAAPPLVPEDGAPKKVEPPDRIADRLQIDEISVEEHNLLRTMIDNMPDYIYVKDTESRFIVGNAATARVMGAKTPDELVGKTDFDFYPEDLAAQYYADEQTIIQSGRSLIDHEEPIVDPDGNTIWISTTKVPLRNSQGKIVGVVGIGRDITQHKQAEKALAEEHNLLRTLIDNIPDCHIFIKDAESQFLITNAPHLQTLGAETLEEVIGKTDFDLFPQELAEQYYADEQTVIQSGQPLFNRVELVIDHTGRKRWYLTNKVPLRNQDDSVVGLVGLSLDITERKQLEQQIQEVLERRTLQVQTSTEVAQEIAAAPALDDLFRRVVNLVQDRFGYRYVNVYTSEKDNLIIQAGTGEAGRQMKETGHKIALTAEQSVIARAARSGEPVLVPDVSQEPAWLSHPLMSEAKSELAVPIKLGNRVLGVLNVENDTVGSLDEEDQLLLLGLCGQIAIAIDNRRAEAARQWAEESLGEERTLLRTLIDNIPDLIYAKDTESRFIISNIANARLMGTTPDGLVGKTDLDFHPQELSEKYYADEQVLIHSGQPLIDKEELVVDPDGNRRWLSTTKVPLRDDQGKIVGLVGLGRDVTEHKRVEATLAKRAAELETVAQVSAAIATILNSRELLQAVVDLTKEGFDLYHVHIYLLNETDNTLDLAASTAEFGQQRMTEGWRIPLERKQSLVVRAAHTQRGVVVNNVQETPQWLPDPLLPDTCSELAVPLMMGGRVLGVFDVQAEEINRFTEEDIHIQTMLAMQVAAALQNASLYKHAQDALKETLVLPQFSQALGGTLSVEKILDIFFEACTNEIGFEYVQVALVDEDQHRVKAIAGVGVSESSLRRADYSLDSDNILADVIKTGQTEVIPDWDDRLDREIFEVEGHADWVRVYAPITLRQERIGVVEAGFTKKVQTTIQTSQIRLLGAFIDQTALALDNARLYEATQNAARREQTIRQITEKMRSATTLDELVQTTATELGERLSAGNAVVELGVETDRHNTD